MRRQSRRGPWGILTTSTRGTPGTGRKIRRPVLRQPGRRAGGQRGGRRHRLHRQTSAHADDCIGALAAGKHVLCEKPMATSLDQAEAIALAAAQSGRILMVAQNQRFHPAISRRKSPAARRTGARAYVPVRVFHSGPENWGSTRPAPPGFSARRKASSAPWGIGRA